MLSSFSRAYFTTSSLTSLTGAVLSFVAGHGAHDDDYGGRTVRGKVFDRFVSVWLENTNYNDAQADPNLSFLASQGIGLDNYFALTHPSQPNYVAVVAGEHFGMDNDNLANIPANVSTVADLLDAEGISWAEYQEDMPFSGFTGNFRNPVTGAKDYVRKHNPLISFESVSNVPSRLDKIKNFTLFEEDLAANQLPQWMFITPNMTNDGHDTNVTVAGRFSKNFLMPLLENPHFNSRTLVFLTFDENESPTPNLVRTIVLGSAIPRSLIGTTDSNFYNHYTALATVEANWGLHTLGRHDVGANVLAFVSHATGDEVRVPAAPPTLNSSYPGLFGTRKQAPLQVPNTRLVVNRRTVLPRVVAAWGRDDLQRCTVYKGAVDVPSGANPPVLPAGC